MGSGAMLVHSITKQQMTGMRISKIFSLLEHMGFFKGCRGIVGGLFLFNSLLNAYKNVRNCQMLPSFYRDC